MFSCDADDALLFACAVCALALALLAAEARAGAAVLVGVSDLISMTTGAEAAGAGVMTAAAAAGVLAAEADLYVAIND